MEFSSRLIAEVPNGWIARDSLTLTSGDGTMNVIVSSEPLTERTNTEAYATEQGEVLAHTFPGFEAGPLEPTPLLGGKEGFVRRFQWSPPDAPPVFQVQLYYVEGDRSYTATATCPHDQAAALESTLLAVLRGLRLNDA